MERRQNLHTVELTGSQRTGTAQMYRASIRASGTAETPSTTQLISHRWFHYCNPHFTGGKLRFKETGHIRACLGGPEG